MLPTPLPRRARPRRFGAAAVGLALLAAACDGGPHALANFIDTPFGVAGAEVLTLDGPALQAVMDDLASRFHAYVALREAIPFSSLVDDACLSNLTETSNSFSFDLDVACALGAAGPAEGTIGVRQEAVSFDVTTLDLDYRGVRVGALTVDGIEAITETAGIDGASVRDLDLVQDGVAFDYQFRIGILDSDQTVIDYRLELPGGTVMARLTTAPSLGAIATVMLTGVDGTLTCELRDTPWGPDASAKGLCDNGVVFGLPARP